MRASVKGPGNPAEKVCEKGAKKRFGKRKHPGEAGSDVMIAYDLQCANGHAFEGWFEDALAYEKQEKKGLISCPVCSVTAVNRVPSVFAIKSSQAAEKPKDPNAELAEINRKVADFVEKNFDDVGCEFAKEALKIHYGVAEPRSIRGVSTKEEEKTLEKEGVQFFKIPIPPAPEGDA